MSLVFRAWSKQARSKGPDGSVAGAVFSSWPLTGVGAHPLRRSVKTILAPSSRVWGAELHDALVLVHGGPQPRPAVISVQVCNGRDSRLAASLRSENDVAVRGCPSAAQSI
jgi:hypothetical protein